MSWGVSFAHMAKRPRTPDDNDSPWKEALQLYFPSFLAFFFADIHRDIDWRRGYEALDKEFQQILRKAKLGKRFADKLFKVWLKDGSDCWILIHVEIQAEVEKAFPKRMFEYHLAIRRMYNREVAGLALLCDDQPDWKPTAFGYERWGCRMELTFRIAKLLDWLPRRAELETSDNPIATVVLAHLEAKQTRQDVVGRKKEKLRLAKGLLQRNWSADDVRELFRLIDWLMALPEDLDEEFKTEFFKFEEEKNVAYVTSVERSGIKKGLLEAIALDLRTRFGRPGSGLMQDASHLPLDELRRFLRFLKKAQSLDEVREYLK
jgi:hypothetical protein